MNLSATISHLESLRTRKELEVAKAVAELRGIDAQLASLKSGAARRGDLATLPRTEAIVQVLHSSGTMLTPTEIVLRLNAGGRQEDRRSVTATLDYLLKRGLVLRPSKGLYLTV